MNLETFLGRCPDYAKDLKLNLPNVLRQTELTPQQSWGTAVACAMASRNPDVSAAIQTEAAGQISPEALHAAKAAAALMGMNNIFYRFQHLSSNQNYSAMPARLRMQAIRTHGSDPIDFELWCLAVSALNGCGRCVDAHERTLREKGVSEGAILAAVRIAAVIHGLAAVFDTERIPVSV